MRFMIMHKTNAHWEAGARPSEALIASVGKMLGELTEAGALLAAEGLRATSEGVRLRFLGGARTVTPGPFEGDNELPAGFAILRVATLDDAVEWASRFATTSSRRARPTRLRRADPRVRISGSSRSSSRAI